MISGMLNINNGTHKNLFLNFKNLTLTLYTLYCPKLMYCDKNDGLKGKQIFRCLSVRNYFFILLLFLNFISFFGIAQSDSLVFERQGLKNVIELKKVKSLEQLKTIAGLGFPVYAISEKELMRLKNIINTYIKLESEYDKLKINFNQKDSIHTKKANLFLEIDSLQRMRASNYEQAYVSLIKVNEQLNNQLIHCEKLTKKERRKGKLSAALFGILGGLSAGLMISLVLQ